MTRKEAINKIKMWDFLDDDKKEVLKTLFPELKESENERIRKLCEEFIRTCFINELCTKEEKDDCIAWLEKQGEKPRGKSALEAIKEEVVDNANKVEPKFGVGDFIADYYCRGKIVKITDDSYLLDTGQGIPFSCEHNTHLWTIKDAKNGDVLTNGKMIVIFKHFEEPSYRQHIVAYIGLDIGGDIQITDDTWRLGIDKAKPATKEQRDLLFTKMKEAGLEWDAEKKELRKIEQKLNDEIEPKFKVGDTMRTLQEANDGYTDGMPVVVSIDNEYYHCTNELIAIKDQDDYEFPPINMKQKPIDNVKPKFKVGDWITNGFDCTFQIASIENGIYYDTNDCGSDIESTDKYYRLWTLEDAKGGDVLYFSDETIVIFKDLYNATTFHSYCHIEDNVFDISKDDMPDWWEGAGFHPATKEQRDILFQKMKEAGYEWDEKKKGLKKISQRMISAEAKEALYDKPAWSEEDNYGFDCVAQCITQATLSSDNKQDLDICKCARNWFNSIKQRLTNT